jgi:hypothetical protein
MGLVDPSSACTWEIPLPMNSRIYGWWRPLFLLGQVQNGPKDTSARSLHMHARRQAYLPWLASTTQAQLIITYITTPWANERYFGEWSTENRAWTAPIGERHTP